MLRFEAENYHLIFPDDRPFVVLETPSGERLAELFTYSSLHPINGRDDTIQSGQWTQTQENSETTFTLETHSTAWARKIYRFRCSAHDLRYDIEVHGSGRVAEIDYFGGYYSGQVRWGSGFFWSGQSFVKGFNPEPTSLEDYSFNADGGALLDLTGVPLPGKSSWFFTPPPYCFAFAHRQGWLGMGIEAAAGENSYTDYHYRGIPSAFHLRLTYEGYTAVSGQFRSPAVGFYFAAGPYEVLSAHACALRERGLAPVIPHAVRPGWWRKPIFCGWGAQCGIANRHKGRAPDYARQSLYEEFLNTLCAQGIEPGIVVLDDKWQAAYGDNTVNPQKWPDVRAFIDNQHAAGRKVLLWLKAWDVEGLPIEECITNAAGLPVAFDPTNPAFEQRLRASVRRMLSAEGYDADGFKIDFSARIPASPGLHLHQEIWGLELMKTYLRILYSEAKRVKPDALVMAHTPHPYLADVLDMIRLNDVNTGHPVNPAMIHRARVASIACPEAVIDTDNWPMPDKKSWREYLKIQPDLGVPSLYFATHIDSSAEDFDEEDYRLIRETWDRWRKKQEGML